MIQPQFGGFKSKLFDLDYEITDKFIGILIASDIKKQYLHEEGYSILERNLITEELDSIIENYRFSRKSENGGLINGDICNIKAQSFLDMFSLLINERTVSKFEKKEK